MQVFKIVRAGRAYRVIDTRTARLFGRFRARAAAQRFIAEIEAVYARA